MKQTVSLPESGKRNMRRKKYSAGWNAFIAGKEADSTTDIDSHPYQKALIDRANFLLKIILNQIIKKDI